MQRDLATVLGLLAVAAPVVLLPGCADSGMDVAADRSRQEARPDAPQDARRQAREEASPPTAEDGSAEPPPSIRAWMDRLTVDHEYDPVTGFIVARQTIALPVILSAAPSLDEAVRIASEDDRLVIAFATADRCAPCQQYKKDALNDPRVVAMLGDPRLLPTHVEVDARPDLATTHLGGAAIPMTYALRDGRPIASLRGQRSADELIARNRHLGDQPMVCPHVPAGGAQALAGDPDWLGFSTDSAMLALVSQLIGPDIILWGTNLFAKPARTGRRVPFHRDGRYWPIEPLATATVWLAVDDASRANGCLRVVPGSHRARTVGAHHTSTRPEDLIPETLEPAEYSEADAVDIELEAGQMVVFDVFTVHGSNPNPSGRRRAGYAMRYMPSTSHFNHAAAERRDQPGNAHHTRPLFLLRGIDRCGRNDLRVGHPG